MKKFIILTTTILLSACKPNDSSPPPAKASMPQVLTASAASEATMAASSPIVSQILNSPQEQDILASSRQAMAEVSASEVAVASAVMASAAQQAEATAEVAPEDTVKLPPVCEAYYQRVDKCFAKDHEFAAELREMNQEARLDLAHDNPTDKACTSLNQSFNAVARNLGCE